MSYTPPTGNAVTFNFSGTYLQPFGSFVPFQFGVIAPPPPPPPPGSAQLPTALRMARMEEDEWVYRPRLRYASIIAVVAVLPYTPPARSGLVIAQMEDEPWRFRYQPISFVPAVTTSRRPFLFTVL